MEDKFMNKRSLNRAAFY